MAKNASANAEDARDANLIHGLGRSPGAGNDNLSSILKQLLTFISSSILAWTEEPGRLHEVAKSQTQLSD